MNNQRQNPIQQAEFSFMGASTTNTTSGSFSDLLNSSFVVGDDDGGYKLFSPGNGGGSRITEKNGSSVGGVPKFKSVPPPSLPISPPPYFAMPPGLSPSELLDSPVLLSSSDIFPSPTTGAIAAQSSIWKQKQHQEDHAATIKQEDNNLSDFTFPTQKTPNDTTVALKAREQEHQRQQEGRGIAVHQHHHQQENKLENQSQPSQQQQIQLYGREQKKSDDGYNWRKYGQKQVKGSENPRSYYKCTFPSCPMKKKIEKSLVDGQITEIVYKGSHNHLKPANTRRSSATGGGGVGYLTSSAAAAPCQSGFKGCGLNFNNDSTQDQENSSFGSGQSVATPEMENSSISMADDFETDGVSDSHRSRSAAGDEYDHVDQRDAKRWKAGGEGESECMSAAPAGLTGSSRTVREPRVVVQTTSDIDILDDGYRWRKYGQKVVKGNPNPRSYYKCTYAGCQVRKHVERAAHDYGAVITTYEGKHNHDVPAARGVSNGGHRPPPSENNNGNSYSYMSGGLNMAVRPLASYEPRLSSTSQQQGQQYHAHQLQSSLAPFTLEMLQNPGAAPGTSVGLENSAASYGYGNEQIPQHDHWLHYYNTTTNNNNNNNSMMMMNGHYNGNNTTGSIINSRGAKDEPVRDDAFLESLLC